MKEQAAYSLLYLAGKTPTKSDVEKLLNDSGCTVDKEALSTLFAALEKTSVVDAIAAGSKKLITMPSGGGARAPAAGGAAAAEAPKADEKKEEEEAVDMGGLFGDEDDY